MYGERERERKRWVKNVRRDFHPRFAVPNRIENIPMYFYILVVIQSGR